MWGGMKERKLPCIVDGRHEREERKSKLRLPKYQCSGLNLKIASASESPLWRLFDQGGGGCLTLFVSGDPCVPNILSPRLAPPTIVLCQRISVVAFINAPGTLFPYFTLLFHFILFIPSPTYVCASRHDMFQNKLAKGDRTAWKRSNDDRKDRPGPS